jgi:ubiquinone/menaquinone biosynthesis C-methylase UbiE
MTDECMSPPSHFQPRRFRTTAAAYARFRLGYPDRLIRRVIDLTGLKPGDSVLDLGSGPGLLALPFAREGMAVTAVDPEPEMLEALENAAKSAGLPVRALPGSSFDLPPGPFRLVTIGRAFHWMDRTETVRALDRMILPGGALALFDDEIPKTAENRWWTVLDDVASRYGAAGAPHRMERADPSHRAHVSILLESPFSRLETAGVIVRRELSTEDIIGLARSLSVTSAQTLGERTAAFEDDLRRALEELSPDGQFAQIAEMKALVAWRAS